jgi:formylglycine-generating enzyme
MQQIYGISFSATLALSVSFIANSALASTVSFGSGANTFTMDFVSVGNVGNADDSLAKPSASGAVAYAYSIGTYEVSREQIIKANVSGISMQDMTNYGGNGAKRPATGMSWNESAKFINYLNTITGNAPAYKFDGSGAPQPWTVGDAGYNPANPIRNSGARFVLASISEWHKAAFYDPTKSGGAGGYWTYANQSNTAPSAISGGTNGAVWNQLQANGPADVTNAGSLSYYGTMGQNGNAFEWTENIVNTANDARLLYGGAWSTAGNSPLKNAAPGSEIIPSSSNLIYGLRVVDLGAVPAPGAAALIGLAGLVASRRRRN